MIVSKKAIIEKLQTFRHSLFAVCSVASVVHVNVKCGNNAVVASNEVKIVTNLVRRWNLIRRRRYTRGVLHHDLAIYITKHLNAKEELWKLKYFTMQKYNLQKIL